MVNDGDYTIPELPKPARFATYNGNRQVIGSSPIVGASRPVPLGPAFCVLPRARLWRHPGA